MDKRIISRLPLPSEILRGGFTNSVLAMDENGKEVAYPSVTARYFSPWGAIKLYEHFLDEKAVQLDRQLHLLFEDYNEYIDFLLGATGYKDSILMMRKVEKLVGLRQSNCVIPWHNPRGKFMNPIVWGMMGWIYRIFGGSDVVHSSSSYFSTTESINPPYKHYPHAFSPPPFVFRIQATSPIWKAALCEDEWELTAIADDSWWRTANIGIKTISPPII